MSAAEAQRTQAELNIELRKERLESELTQADAAVQNGAGESGDEPGHNDNTD